MNEIPTTLHTQQGLTIRKNPKNSFVVCTLHYTADPHKRTEAWRKEAMAGLTKPKWEQEYEISYTALFGEKVFPEIEAKREVIICKSPFIDGHIPADLACWGGFDYGANNPSSFHVYTIYDGVIYAIWELYEPCKNIFEFSKKMKDCPYWDQIRYIAADPDIFNLKQRNMKTGATTSVATQFAECGIHKLIEGNNDEAAWVAEMRTHWAPTDPTFRIFEECSRMIWEFENILFRSMSDRQLQSANYAEAMVDKNNHALDDCKYFMNSKAKPVNRKLRIPNMIQGYRPTTAVPRPDSMVEYR